MSSFISVSITGHVGGQPELRQVNDDNKVATFSVAMNRKRQDGTQEVLWVRVNCWNKLADVAMSYINKGDPVQVIGEWLRPSAWIDRSGNPQASLDMSASRLILLGNNTNSANNTPPDMPAENIPF